MGHRPSPPRLSLEQDPGPAADTRTPAERQSLVAKQRRKSAVQAALGRAAAGVAVSVVIAAALLWARTQAWWAPDWVARLPQPSRIAHGLRHPDLAALPGLSAQWNPWAPLTLQEPESLLTRWKIGQLEGDPAACRAWLAAAPDTDQTPLPEHTESSTLLCGWKTASRIGRLDGVRFSSPFPLACGAAVALARWERHTLQPAARAYLGSEVVRIDHVGSYACRTLGSGAAGQLSAHASANALDIARFALADGQVVGVSEHWPHAGEAPNGAPRASTQTTAEAAFLQAARDGACRSFHTVLGPDSDAAHRDHFHFDRGGHRACR